jgi:ubiquinone/menaquinone biosynthesis C-methylase UbiE
MQSVARSQGLASSTAENDNLSEENEWKNPDSAIDPTSYVRYLDGIFAGMKSSGPAVDYKRQVYQMMEITAGDSIIDIGCGTGADVLALSELLMKAGGGGKVTGVDISDTMIREAQDRLKRNDSRIFDSATIEFDTGDAQSLIAIPSDSFHICRSDRSLQHMPSPKAAIEEMVRITKPGVGRIIVTEPDWETLVIDSPSYDQVTRKIINHFTDTRVNGWMGRQLPRLFRNAGLVDVMVVPMTAPVTNLSFIRAAYLDKARKTAVEASVVTEKEASEWMSELDDLNKAGQFFSSLTIYCVRGHVK